MNLTLHVAMFLFRFTYCPLIACFSYIPYILHLFWVLPCKLFTNYYHSLWEVYTPFPGVSDVTRSFFLWMYYRFFFYHVSDDKPVPEPDVFDHTVALFSLPLSSPKLWWSVFVMLLTAAWFKTWPAFCFQSCLWNYLFEFNKTLACNCLCLCVLCRSEMKTNSKQNDGKFRAVVQ